MNHDKYSYWLDYRELDSNEKKIVSPTKKYLNNNIALFDAAYQLWHKGLINCTTNKNLNIVFEQETPLIDQYRFIRRMYKPLWIYYVFFIRIITLKVSINDFISVLKTKGVNRIKLNDPFYNYKDYDRFESNLLSQSPLVTVVIPTLNRYDELSNLLNDLEYQDYKNIEIIIIDQSDSFNKLLYDKFNLNINLIRQIEKGLWRARNHAIKISNGDLILLLDDDSRVEKNWITEHIKCIDFFNADISAGVSISSLGAPVPNHYNYFRWADQLDTGNVLLKKKVFITCGLFDLQFEGMRMGDDEFGARAFINGFKSINNPRAKRLHLKIKSGGLRQMGSWDGMRPISIFKPRPIPSILYYFRRYWGNRATILYLIQVLPISINPYSLKGRKIGYFISLLSFFLFFPFILIQLYRSWIKSNIMIENGPMIESLK